MPVQMAQSRSHVRIVEIKLNPSGPQREKINQEDDILNSFCNNQFKTSAGGLDSLFSVSGGKSVKLT